MNEQEAKDGRLLEKFTRLTQLRVAAFEKGFQGPERNLEELSRLVRQLSLPHMATDIEHDSMPVDQVVNEVLRSKEGQAFIWFLTDERQRLQQRLRSSLESVRL